MSERHRGAFRQPVALPVRMRLFDGSTSQAVTLDLSATGVRLLAPFSPPLGARAHLRIGGDDPVEIQARVVGSRPVADRYEVRLTFSPLSASAEERLHHEVRAIERAVIAERAEEAESEDEPSAPFVPSAPASPEGRERRRSRRVRIETRGRIRVGTAYVSARVLDISSGGAKVRLGQPMRVGEDVTFPIPGLDVEVHGTVRSVRIRPRDLHFEIGIVFRFDDVGQARAVRAHVVKLRRRAELATG
ncbi:MAG TPA: PilZ domain-containing protein [Candidatus Dormibacteraeota bacterium]|nr:PilZ domain-containing protein [Candidatus Dormibacteraeota bacterium]